MYQLHNFEYTAEFWKDVDSGDVSLGTTDLSSIGSYFKYIWIYITSWFDGAKVKLKLVDS